MEQQEASEQYAAGQYVDPRAQLHSGVGQFMAGVYLWMAVGVGITAVVATAMSMNHELMAAMYNSGFGFYMFIPLLVFVWFISSRIPRMDRKVALASFLVFAAMMGAMLSYVPGRYALDTMASAFGTSAAGFAALAAYGYFTKRDLSALGQFLIIGLVGVFVAILASYFIPGISILVSVIGLAVFGALTAYESQGLRQGYLAQGDQGNLQISGALGMYLNFINIFLFLLRIFNSDD